MEINEERGVNSFQCYNCDYWMKDIHYNTNNGKRSKICIGCFQKNKGPYFDLKYEREVRNNLREDTRLTRRENTFKTYNLSKVDYMKMYVEQKGCCKICGSHEDNFNRRLAIDHCHETGMIRGLLCGNCNTGLGMLGDNFEGLKSAFLYISNLEEKRKEIMKLLG